VGIDLLREQIKAHIGYHGNSDGIFLARRRHLDALIRATHHVQHGWQQLLKICAKHKIVWGNTGTFTSEDLLGRIFASFCIGK